MASYPTDPLATPQNGLVLTVPYRKVIWSIAVQLGRRFGQLWPNGYGPTEPPE